MSAGAAVRMLRAWLVCLGWLYLGWAQAQAQPACTPQVISIQSARAAADEPVPQVAASADWLPVSLPDNWSERWPGYAGAAWYRIHWRLECPVGASAGPVALGIASIVMAGEVYSNRDLIWRDQHLREPLSRSWNLPRVWILPQSSLLPGADNHIWVRVHGAASERSGLLGPLRLGDPQELGRWLDHRWWHQRTLFTVNLVVSGVLMLLFAFAWVQRPSSTVFGWYAFNSLCWVLFVAMVLMTEAAPFPSTEALARACMVCFILFSFSFHRFVWRFGEQRFPRLELALWIGAAAALGAVIFTPARLQEVALAIVLICVLLSLANMLQFIVHAWRTRKLEHMVFAGCLVGFTGAGTHDFLGLFGRNLLNHALTPYTAPLTMLALSLVLGRQVMLNMRRVERFNQELAHSVSQACEELGTTLAREHQLALSNSRLQERLRLSQDLHDSLGGSLVRSIAYVEQAGQPLRNTQFLSMLKLMRDDLRQMIDTSASAAIATPDTPTEWAAPLRYRFVGLFDELGIGSQWNIPSRWVRPPEPLQCLALTRLVEEALTNVIKHSRAGQVSITLDLPDAERLELSIIDDGVGFDVLMTESGSMGVGMRSMRARVERIGGRLLIASEPGRTCIRVQMPLAVAVAAGASKMAEAN